MSYPSRVIDDFVTPDPTLGFFQLGLLMILAFTFGALDWLFGPVLGILGYQVIIYTSVTHLVCTICANFVLPTIGLVSLGIRVSDLMEAASLIGWALRLSAIVAWAGRSTSCGKS